jgi:hypothetical protein
MKLAKQHAKSMISVKRKILNPSVAAAISGVVRPPEVESSMI